MADQDLHPSFWEKYVRAPLDLVMNNSIVLSPALLILAVAPFVITAVVLALVLIRQ